MLRLLILFILLFFLYRILRSLLVSGKKGKRYRPSDLDGTIDELIQDPICKTYVPLRNSEKRTIMGRAFFFCSKECADKFEERLKGSPDRTDC